MSKPTSGPWQTKRARHPSDGGFDYAISAKVGMYERCIAEAFEVVDAGVKVPAEANARLMAAAPDLLAALEAALPHLDNSDSPGGCDGTQQGCDHCAAIQTVRAAIAKARIAP